MNDNINDIKETQRDMEDEFNQALNNSSPKTDLKNATKNLKAATHALNRSFKQNPFGSDIFQKIEADRSFIINLLVTWNFVLKINFNYLLKIVFRRGSSKLSTRNRNEQTFYFKEHYLRWETQQSRISEHYQKVISWFLLPIR